MLKKLVKYGNSNALILDKALLEILNIAEGSTLKIRTDGTSLVITPVEHALQDKITSTITPHETLTTAMNNAMDAFTKTKVPGEGQAYLNELKSVLAHYEQSIKDLLNSPQFKEELNTIEQRFKGNCHNSEYYQAIAELHKKHNPKLIAMENEIKEVSKKYAPVEYQYRDVDNKGAFTLALDAFKKVHEKYVHLRPQLIQIHENQEYIHESVLLAEKYQYTKNSPEYLKEYTGLIAKYIPEYAAYQEEIQKVSENCK